jgi:hypothetical protein
MMTSLVGSARDPMVLEVEQTIYRDLLGYLSKGVTNDHICTDLLPENPLNSSF